MARAKEAEHLATKCRKAPPSLGKFPISEVEVDGEVVDEEANVAAGPATSMNEGSASVSETPANNTRSRRTGITPSDGQTGTAITFNTESKQNLRLLKKNSFKSLSFLSYCQFSGKILKVKVF